MSNSAMRPKLQAVCAVIRGMWPHETLNTEVTPRSAANIARPPKPVGRLYAHETWDEGLWTTLETASSLKLRLGLRDTR